MATVTPSQDSKATVRQPKGPASNAIITRNVSHHTSKWGLNPFGPLSRYIDFSTPYICREHWRLYKNFESLVSPERAAQDVQFLNVERLTTNRSIRRSCLLCKLIASVISESYDFETPQQNDVRYSLRVSFLVVRGATFSAMDKTPTPVPRALCLRIAKSLDNDLPGGGQRGSAQTVEGCGYLIPAPATFPTAKIQKGTWDQNKIDIDLIRSWLNDCKIDKKSSHQNCQESVFGPVLGLNVIDCDTRRLTKKPDDQLYVALSYVWGPVQTPKSSNQSTQSASLLDAAPRTILDAVVVTVALGYRYLWVDRYCIPQDDLDEKKRQLNMMGEIYSSADLTIVAAAGDDDQYGLPGADTHPIVSRPLRNIASLRERSLTSVVDLSTLLSRTKWKTRGWTFQEAQLSRRRLYFTKSEVVLHCNGHAYYESLSLYDATLPSNMPSLSAQLPSRLFSQFSLDVTAYQERSFTYESDAMFGFKGILSCYNMYTYWAIPFIIGPNDWHKPKYESYTKSFLSGLCWRVLNADFEIEKREDMPSWSWISMGTASGRIDFPTDPLLLLHIMGHVVDTKLIPEFKQDFEARSSCEGVQLFIRDNEFTGGENSGWVALDDVVDASSTLVIDEKGLHIKIEAPTVSINTIRILESAPGQNRVSVHALIFGERALTTISSLYLDSKGDLDELEYPKRNDGLCRVHWKLVCIYKWMGYSQSLADERGGDGTFFPWQTHCLILARSKDSWKRVGCAIVSTELEEINPVVESFVIS